MKFGDKYLLHGKPCVYVADHTSEHSHVLVNGEKTTTICCNQHLKPYEEPTERFVTLGDLRAITTNDKINQQLDEDALVKIITPDKKLIYIDKQPAIHKDTLMFSSTYIPEGE